MSVHNSLEMSRMKENCYHPIEMENLMKILPAIEKSKGEILDLTDIKVSSLPFDLALRFPDLKVLEIGGNAIRELPEGLEGLVKLDWSRNGLIAFPGQLYNFTRLEELDLSDNRIQHISSEVVLEMKSLKELNLNNHQLSTNKYRDDMKAIWNEHPTLHTLHYNSSVMNIAATFRKEASKAAGRSMCGACPVPAIRIR